MNTGDADEIVVEFPRIQARSDDAQPAITEAAQRARAAGITWLRPNGREWVVDGDTLRGMTEELASLPWLTGNAAIMPRYERREMLRAGGGASQGSVILAFDEAAWAASRKPWAKHWHVSAEKETLGGQGTGQAGAITNGTGAHRRD